ncbi:MAG: MFS transporter, partial [Actinomycetota bacterium]
GAPGEPRDETGAAERPVAGDATPLGPDLLVPPPVRLRDRVGILRPLRRRDFALLWSGMTISLLGDGIYFVALPFQVFAIADGPGALALVGAVWSLPQVFLFLVAGVLTDRIDRRRVLIGADVVRAVALAGIGLLAVTGGLELWNLLPLVVVYGAGNAFFMPAFQAIVPDIVPKDLLVEANALDQFVRPMSRLMGPALGGAVVAIGGTGSAFLVDGLTFAVSAVAIAAIRARPGPRSAADGPHATVLRDVREGWRFVRAHVWLWGTLAAAAGGLLCFYGPLEVLVPVVVKDELGGDATDFGLILAGGGLGSIAVSLAMGQRGLPRNHMVFMYLAWGGGTMLIALYAFVTATWQAIAVGIAIGGLFTLGMVVWGTLLQKLVPSELLGRVSSFDWLVSTSLVPLSFALTAPAAALLGAQRTLVAAGLLGGLSFTVFLLLPGMRDTERDERLHADPALVEEEPATVP